MSCRYFHSFPLLHFPPPALFTLFRADISTPAFSVAPKSSHSLGNVSTARGITKMVTQTSQGYKQTMEFKANRKCNESWDIQL